MKGFVYILQSVKNGRFYVGCSEDPTKRLNDQHNLGKVKATKYLIPWQLIKTIKCDNITEARKLEWKIKSMKSRKYIEFLIHG